MKAQRGGFVLGLVVGLLVGLALALGVALYITKMPAPFVNKVPHRTPEQDSAEAERNRSWDPNAPLGGRPAQRAAQAPASAGTAPPAPALPPAAEAAAPPGPPPAAPPQAASSARNPAAILSGAPVPPPRSTAGAAEPFIYFVQAGAFTRTDDAEQQRAKLALMGHSATISEREQAGRTVYRVRLGPLRNREEADALQSKLQEGSIEAQIVRVERP